MKKLIAVIMTMAILFSSAMAAVYADTGSADMSKYAAGKFRDIKANDWFAEDVGKLNTLKIIDGFQGSFNPNGQVTRAEFIKMLVQAMQYKKVDSISFKDLKPFASSKPHWACVYIETALRNDVILKDEIGENFYPDASLTRIDMAMMMARAMKIQPSTGENPFADLQEANGYATKLYEEYLIRGSLQAGKRLYKPDGLTTRAEAAAILSRMLEYKADPVGYVAKQKKQETINAVTSNGVPLRLYEYTEGTSRTDASGTYKRTFKEANEAYYNLFAEGSKARYGYPEVEKFSSVDEFVKYQVDLVKRYMEYNWNVDYRTVGQKYIDGIGNTLGINSAYDAKKNIVAFKKYKVIVQSEFLTDYDLIYFRDGKYPYLRGTLRINFDKSTNADFIKNTLRRQDIISGKWYDIDMEIFLTRDSIDRTWNVYKNNYYDIFAVIGK